MDFNMRSIIGLVALGIAVFSVAAIGMYFLLPKRNQKNLSSLMGSSQATPIEPKLGKGSGAVSPVQMSTRLDEEEDDLEALSNRFRKTVKAPKLSIQEKLFQAGLYAPEDLADFRRFRIIAPIVSVVLLVVPTVLLLSDPMIIICVLVMAGLVGAQVPLSWLDRRRKKHADEILYYLPIVIEQVSVGVSSSLDVGPCLANIVNMADERDVHNPVTEIIRIVLAYVRSGVSLQESLGEIGKRCGHTELKHAFMSLAQVAKHGGEVTKQLQELADSVSSQREAKIEEKIKKLELEATGPVALVFLGFIIIFLIGFFIQIKKAFI